MQTCRRCKKPKAIGAEMSHKCADCKSCRAEYECCHRGKFLTTYSKCCPRDANNYNRRHGAFPLMQFMSEISVEGANEWSGRSE